MVIEKKYHFYAAHRNKGAGEKCGRIHGHTYNVKCHFQFQDIDNSGITYLFSDIDKLVEPIIKEYCHWLLLCENDSLVDVLQMANEPIKLLPFETSAENMSLFLFTRIKNDTNLPITKLELSETKSSNINYEP